MQGLKPCPFCGSDDVTVLWVDNIVKQAYCRICGAEICRYDIDSATSAWNTRAERTCHIVPHGYCIANGEESSCRCWSCSECSYGWHVSDYDRQYRYCPNCGARVVE